MNISDYEKDINSFLSNYFKDISALIDFNRHFIEHNGLKWTKIEYIKLMRFVQTAMENLKTIDTKIYSGLAGKLYNDCRKLYEYYKIFEKSNKNASLVYHQKFLKSIPEYNELKAKYETLSTRESALKSAISVSNAKLEKLEQEDKVNSFEYKNTKKMNVDSTHEASVTKDKLIVVSKQINNIEFHLFKGFENIFYQKVSNYLSELKKCINSKIMFLDKVLLSYTSKSKSVQEFFKSAGIQGDFDIKNFIRYYMKNINTSKVKSSGWHSYLEECLLVLE